VAAIAAELLAQGLPAVTLHVRADNEPACGPTRAGFVDWGPWMLAIR
jgi:ribosomal protein S18 acetylase RimI-like enzyme